MLSSVIFILLSILALSFLIFIHELGHYFMARRVGMRVETFAIGFGSPLFSWESSAGVKWQVGWIPFGGYVKIAGTETGEGFDPYKVKDGFFGRGPWARIKVAFMGPFVNLVFAFLAFTMIWALGGRGKEFHELTRKVGWVDPESELYALGVRPGDEILSYDAQEFGGAKDHLYAALTGGEEVVVEGNHVDYTTGKKKPFSLTARTYPHPRSIDGSAKSVGVLEPAYYLTYDRLPGGRDNPLPNGSPLEGKGIEYGDRVLWVDGELVFSQTQLGAILNEAKALLTVERNNRTLLVRVPRVKMEDLKPNAEFREELVDWQFEAGLGQIKPQQLFAIPYGLTNDCIVEEQLSLIDGELEAEAFPKYNLSEIDQSLQVGDRILAVDGTPVSFSFELLALLQEHSVTIIVDREPEELAPISWEEADEDFDRHLHGKQLALITRSIGSHRPIKSMGSLSLLSPVTPKVVSEFALTPEQRATLKVQLLERQKEFEAIEDHSRRARMLRLLEEDEQQLKIGLPQIQDRQVQFNPDPYALFSTVFEEIWRTLSALVSGNLSPKWMAGPVGVVTLVHQSSMASLKEALFWLGAISLNLGVLNLLPIPILDGGTIVFAFFEIVTRKRLGIKTMEKLIVPFAVILIAFFLYLTYNDVSRLFGG